ncbi:MAG: sugar isomerase domain-containing protein [Erysipelotrichaceae bacterium]|jgi:uncharacterized phosphosugar-binding protein
MEIKKKYVEILKAQIEKAYDTQHKKIVEVSNMFGQCMSNGGVVQLFGIEHDEEFVNELNYRAGGIAPFHALKIRDLTLKGGVEMEDVKSGKIYLKENVSKTADVLMGLYDLDDRDMYVLVSAKGNNPLVLELAERVKTNGQKLVAVVNKAGYDASGGTLLDYADIWLDMCSFEPDVAIDLDGVKIGQTSSTVANVIAQMLTAETYRYFIETKGKAPVLFSANIKGADVHNNALTDPYGRRVR